PKNPDPTDPTTPNYPNPTDPAIQTLTENVKRTVRYVDESGKVIAEEVVDNLGFTRTGTINLATGEITLGEWTPTAGDSFENKKSPVVPGYILKDPSQVEAGAHTGVKATDDDYVDAVVYVPVGNYVPEFPPGVTPENPWTEVPYVTDPTNPSQIVPPTDPSQPAIPYVPGMTPVDPG
ncbi:mucin-binding protein, partial [Streptococcus sp. 10F2]